MVISEHRLEELETAFALLTELRRHNVNKWVGYEEAYSAHLINYKHNARLEELLMNIMSMLECKASKQLQENCLDELKRMKITFGGSDET